MNPAPRCSQEISLPILRAFLAPGRPRPHRQLRSRLNLCVSDKEVKPLQTVWLLTRPSPYPGLFLGSGGAAGAQRTAHTTWGMCCPPREGSRLPTWAAPSACLCLCVWASLLPAGLCFVPAPRRGGACRYALGAPWG